MSILVFLSGIPSISGSASIVNLDFINIAQEQQNSDVAPENSDQRSVQNDIQNDPIPKINNSLAVPENRSNVSHLLYHDHSNTTDFLKGSGLLKKGPFQEESQTGLSESNRALDSIKTSLKSINADLNEMENRAFSFLADEGMDFSLNSLAAQTNLLANPSQQRQYVDTQINNFGVQTDKPEAVDMERQLEDQPLLYQLLFFVSIPHLLKLISANLTSLSLMVFVWLLIHGVIKFTRWKMKKKKRSRLKKKRSIDGFTKY